MRHALFQVRYSLPSSVSSKSFACHSHENCRGVAQLFPFWNPPLKKSLSILSPQLSLAVRPVPLPSVPLSPIRYPLSFQILAHSFVLFCTPRSLNCFIFNPFRTLRQKTKRSRQPFPPRAQFSTRPSPTDHGTRFRTQSHEARTTSRRVAAVPSECYDLVFHDPC